LAEQRCRAQDARRIVVNVPFEFVAGCETLPAGAYKVGRVSTEAVPDLVIRSDEKSALLLSLVFDGVPAERAKLGFGGSDDYESNKSAEHS
jgi:hypothetical protein